MHHTHNSTSLWWIIINLLIGLYIGSRRGRPVAGIILAVLLGPIGWFLMAFFRGNARSCPFCASNVNKAALVCPHCQRDLPPAPRAGFNWGAWMLLVAILLVIGGILYQPILSVVREARLVDAAEATTPAPAQKPDEDNQAAPQRQEQKKRDDIDEEKAELTRKLAAGTLQLPLTRAVEIPNQYGKVTLPARTIVTVTAVRGDYLDVRTANGTLTIPRSCVDMPVLEQ